MKKQIFLACALASCSLLLILADEYSPNEHSASVQYVYSVADIDGESLLVMHQRSLYNVELLKWNTRTRIAQKALWSIYQPSSVTLLPEGDGFSFLDQGRIRVKDFNKRSPRTINIFEPITNFDSIQWIDNEHFYFTAQDPYFHNVFACQLNKNSASVSRLTFEEESDFLYPQKVGNDLFAIKRGCDKKFSIVRLDWKEYSFDNYKETAGEIIVASSKCCCFLKMINSQQGYFISYDQGKEPLKNTHTFWCNAIIQEADGWKQQQLFSFDIHENYILGREAERMYESIKPLLPCYEKHGIFFSHFDNETAIPHLKRYNIQTGEISAVHVEHKKKLSPFTPFISQGYAYCGMAIRATRSFLETHCIDGDFQFDILKIEI